MTEWTLSLLALWFVFGVFYGFKHAWEMMFFRISVGRDDFSVTFGPATLVYLIGLAAIAVS